MRLEWSTVAVAIVSGISVCISASVLVWLLWSHCSHVISRLREPSSNLLAWRQWLGDIGMSSDVKDEKMRAKVRQQAAVERIRRSRKVVPFLALCQACIALQRELHNMSHLLFDEQDDDCIATLSSAFVMWLIDMLLASMAFRPHIITKRTMRLFYALTVILGLSEVAFTPLIEAASECSGYSPQETRVVRYHVGQLLLAMILQDASFILPMQFVALPAAVCMVLLQSEHHFPRRWVLEIVLFGITCIASVSMERASTASIHSSLEAQFFRAHGDAVDSLLSSMCDAVIRLSKQFDLEKDCPRLSALLLRDPGVPLQANFCDLLASESDRESFRQFVQARDTDGDVLAHTIHVTLRDKYHVPVLVQLFHSICRDSVTDDEVHIVGLRDVGGERHAPVPTDPAAAPSAAHVPVAEKVAGALDPISEYSMPETMSNSETGSVFHPDMSASADAVKVWINTLDAHLPLLGWTPGFANLVGLQSLYTGASFAEFIPSNEEQLRTCMDLQHITNSLMSNEETENAAQRGIEFSVATKHWGIIRICSAVEMDLGFPDDSGESLVALLDFKAWWRTKPRRRNRSGNFNTTLGAAKQPASVVPQAAAAPSSLSQTSHRTKASKVSL